MWSITKLYRINAARRGAAEPSKGLDELSSPQTVIAVEQSKAAEASGPDYPAAATHETPKSDVLPEPAPVAFASVGPQGHRARMREKLLSRGSEALADYELLEMLLYFAMPRGDTKPLAKSLINHFGSFANVLAAPQQALRDIDGLGVHSVAALKLVQAAALRMARAEVIKRPILNTWDRLIDYLTAAMAREKTEVLRVLFLDSKNRLIADEALARGTVNHTPVYPREVIKRALELHATALVLAHNHPSGDPTPSDNDIKMTRMVREAATALSVTLHDHLVIGNGRWLSFRSEGLL